MFSDENAYFHHKICKDLLIYEARVEHKTPQKLCLHLTWQQLGSDRGIHLGPARPIKRAFMDQSGKVRPAHRPVESLVMVAQIKNHEPNGVFG